MRGTAEFQIIGRIGRIAPVGATLKIDIASDYPRRKDDGSWDSNTHWNTVTIFNERTIGWIKENCTPGDLVHARGRKERAVPQVVFRPDFKTHNRAAPFKRNDDMLALAPRAVIVFPGNGITENVA